jgi:hypothetical protein
MEGTMTNPYSIRWLWLGFVVIALIPLWIEDTVAASVFWEAGLDINNKEVKVSIFPHVRMSEVRCEVTFLDGQGKPVTTRWFSFTDSEMPDLLPEKPYEKKFEHNVPEAHSARGHLLFAKPVLASPKAAASTSARELGQGVPAGVRNAK